MVVKRWVIIGFKHPTHKHSIIYKSGLTTEQLLKVLQTYASECNLFSIRGFEETD